MKTIKRILVFILCLCVGLGCVIPAFAADGDIVASGSCGENLTWTLSEDGILTVSGTGAMTSAPWYDIKDQIKSLVLGEGLTSIPARAFYELRNAVGDIVIPDSVESIDAYAFAYYGYGSYTNRKGTLTLGSALKSIGDHAFYRASLVGDVIIPDSVTDIGAYAFNWFGEMTTQYYSEQRGHLRLSGSVTGIEPYTFYEANFDGDLYLPDGITEIGERAFSGCDFNGSLRLPDSLTRIGDNAFSYCSGLAGDLRIPSSVVTIGDYAFKECRGFSGRLTVENPEAQIGTCAFHRCGYDPVEFFAAHPERITCVETINDYGTPVTYAFCADCFDGNLTDHDAWLATYMAPTELNVYVGEHFTVNGATADTCIYRYSDESVAAIIDGEPVAVAKGTAVVTAVSPSSQTICSAVITVHAKPVETYYINTVPYLHPGEQSQLDVHVIPDDAECTIRYEVADDSVATISEDGMISAHRVGRTQFSVHIEYETGSYTSSQLIQVIEPVTGLTIDCGDEIRVPVGTSAVYGYSIEPENAFNKEIRLSLVGYEEPGDNAIRAYKDGDRIVFEANAPGRAVFRIASADNSEIYKDITVVAANEITDITLTVPVQNGVAISMLPAEIQNAMVFTKDGSILRFDENPLDAANEYVLSLGDESMRFRLFGGDPVCVNGLELSAPVFVCDDFLVLGYCDGSLVLTYEGFSAEEEDSIPCTLTAVLGSAITMSAGEVLPVHISAEPIGASASEIRLAVDATAMITADEDSIYAISAGTAVLTITAENEDGFVFSKVYTVVVLGGNGDDTTGQNIDPSGNDDPDENENKAGNVTIYVPDRITAGETAKIRVETDGDMPYTIEYASSDSGVLSVDANGNISGKNSGAAMITVTVRFSDGSVSVKTVAIRVTGPENVHHDGFRCKRCDWYDQNKDHPVALVRCIFWMIHTITHFVQKINALT